MKPKHLKKALIELDYRITLIVNKYFCEIEVISDDNTIDNNFNTIKLSNQTSPYTKIPYLTERECWLDLVHQIEEGAKLEGGVINPLTDIIDMVNWYSKKT